MTQLPPAPPPLTDAERQALFAAYLRDLDRLIGETLSDRDQLRACDLRLQMALGTARLMQTSIDMAKALERETAPAPR